jgi:hypothetical protein
MRTTTIACFMSMLFGVLSVGCSAEVDSQEQEEGDEEDVAELEEGLAMGGCTFLGKNSYCDGDVEVIAFDVMCIDQVGEMRIETTTYYSVGSGYCS